MSIVRPKLSLSTSWQSTSAEPVDGTAKKFAVFGGHMYWSGVEKALGTARGKRPHLDSNVPFECYTSFREPLSRVVPDGTNLST